MNAGRVSRGGRASWRYVWGIVAMARAEDGVMRVFVDVVRVGMGRGVV